MDATYPEDDGFDSIKSRSRVMGKDYWSCRPEFCIFMWLNVVVCTPVFVLILMNVVVNGQADHSYPLPCSDIQLHDSYSPAVLSASPVDSFVALNSVSPVTESEEYDCIPSPLPDANCTGRGYPEWSKLSGSCDEFRNSAKKYRFGREGLSTNDYTQAACPITGVSSSSSSYRGNSGRKSVFYGVTVLARKMVAHLGFATGRAERVHASETVTQGESETETEAEAQTVAETGLTASDARFTSFASPTLLDMLMSQNSEGKWEEKEKDVIVILDPFPGGNTTTTTHNSLGSTSALTLASSAAAASSLSNAQEVCFDFTETVYKWKEDIETYGADMCVITGIAMLVPATPILALDALLTAIAFAVFFSIMTWLALVMGYYIFYIFVWCLCQREVVDGVHEDDNVIITYYHIEDHSPGFNCCICCGMSGCWVFIKGFSGCVVGLVLAFFLSEKICGCCEDADDDNDGDGNASSGQAAA